MKQPNILILLYKVGLLIIWILTQIFIVSSLIEIYHHTSVWLSIGLGCIWLIYTLIRVIPGMFKLYRSALPLKSPRIRFIVTLVAGLMLLGVSLPLYRECVPVSLFCDTKHIIAGVGLGILMVSIFMLMVIARYSSDL